MCYNQGKGSKGIKGYAESFTRVVPESRNLLLRPRSCHCPSVLLLSPDISEVYCREGRSIYTCLIKVRETNQPIMLVVLTN